MKHSVLWKGIVVVIGTCVVFLLAAGCGNHKKPSVPENPATGAPANAGPERNADPLVDARERSKANLEAIATAFGDFDKQHGFSPIGLVDPKTRQMGLSWRVQILPFLKDAKAREVYQQLRLNEPWDSAHNKQFLASMPQVFRPVRGQATEGDTFYQGIARHAVGQKVGDKIEKLAPGQRFLDGTYNSRRCSGV
jgi:hypothetical protein